MPRGILNGHQISSRNEYSSKIKDMLEEVNFQYLYNSSFFNVGLDDLELYQGQSCHLGRIT